MNRELRSSLKKCNYLSARNRREPGQEIIAVVTRLQIIEKGLYWHAATGKNRRPAHYVA